MYFAHQTSTSHFIKHPPIFVVRAFAALCAPLFQAKPLKVFILAGQSNMEGHAEISIFPAVANDLNTSNMPFVTSALGVGSETSGDSIEAFRNAMAAPGELVEFKGTVANVYNHKV